MQYSISFLKSKQSIVQTIKDISSSSADYIHVDVMDGIFTENKTQDLTRYLNGFSQKLDVHLMVEKPIEYILKYAQLKPKYITIHIEINDDIAYLINKIKSFNIKVGLAINPNTPSDMLLPFLNDIDLILVMSVYPGAGGQKFIPTSIALINKLSKLRELNNYKYLLSVDGGINDNTIKMLKNTSLDIVVSGSYICLSRNYEQNLQKLKTA